MNDFLKLAVAEVPRYFTDLLNLTLEPKKFLLQRCAEDDVDQGRVFIFLGMSLLVSGILQLPLLPNRDQLLLRFSMYASASLVTLLISIVIFSAVWRIVGGTATPRQVFVLTAYASMPLSYILLLFSVSGAFFFEALDPAGYIQSMTEPLKAATPEMISRGGLLVSSVFFALGLVASYGWLLYAWSAFREVNRVSKVRSFAAYILCSSAGLLAQLPLYIMSGFNTKF